MHEPRPDDQAHAQTRPESPAQAPVHGPSSPRVLCPYCGLAQAVTARCASCRGLLDAESRQATQNAMGPWYVRSEHSPHHPGCSYATLREQVRRGKVTRDTIIRGPTTRQFWSLAGNTPGVAVLMGECHACHQPAGEHEYLCRHCGVVLSPATDRQHLGLGPIVPVNPSPAQPPIASTASPIQVSGPGAYTIEAASQETRAITPVPAVSGLADELIRRRGARDRTRQGLLLVLSAMACMGVVAVIAMMQLRTGRSQAAHQQPVVGEAAEPPAPTVRFAVELDRASRLMKTGTLEDMERALELLSQVRRDAQPGASAAFLTSLDTRITELRARIDEHKLDELLGPTGDTVGDPPGGNQPHAELSENS